MLTTKDSKGSYATVHKRELSSELNGGLRSRTRLRDTSMRVASWRAPATLLFSLLLGLGIALTHHLVNSHLDRRPTNSVGFSQAWVSRFNTALAFLAKLAFTICVGSAFVQRQWYSFHRRPFKVNEVDSIANVLSNVLSFLDAVWFRNPLLAFMAAMSW